MCYKVYYILRNKNECNICDFFLSKSVRHYLERIHFRPAEKLMLGFPNDFHCPLSPSPFFPHSVSNEIDVRIRWLFFFWRDEVFCVTTCFNSGQTCSSEVLSTHIRILDGGI